MRLKSSRKDSSDEGEWSERKNDPNHRMASRAGKDRERGENRLVHMLKQTYKLTGSILPFCFLRGGGGVGMIKSMQLPRHV